jgi:erythromycin esterase-like protein
VVAQLLELQRRAMEYARRDGRAAEEDAFQAEQNARLVKNAEAYYCSMFLERVSSWNLRDRHMAESLDALVAHLDRHAPPAKVVVWAHNSHVGDAVCFTTDHGTVTAASDWGGPAERKRVRPARPDSYEATFHDTRLARFLLVGEEVARAVGTLRDPRLERAIGVIYRPRTEPESHYFYAWLPRQFDAVLHFDETRAVEPLERMGEWDAGEPPETFPFGV